MGRTATKAAHPVQDVVLDQGAVARIEQAQDANALVLMEGSANAKAMAAQMGYEGPLTVGALEDEIRFYQRRTVEAILETGKRLLMLREVLPPGNSQIGKNGEFEARLEFLGFSKSLNLSILSTQVKSASAFLELITHDDDVLESLKDMDDIDRMSASQLRSTLRQAKEDNKFMAEKRDKESQRADKAEKALKSGGPKLAPISERLQDFNEAVNTTQDAACAALIDLDRQAKELEKWWLDEVMQQPGYVPGEATPMPAEVVAVAQKIHDNVERIAATVGGLQRLIWETYGHEIEAARTYVMQPGAIAGQPLAQAE
jgi:hypothetical protein